MDGEVKIKVNIHEYAIDVSYGELLLLVFDEVSFCIVDEAMTEEQPDEDFL